ncbi:relaxin receptor 1-like [Penaeus indicus]|uniref:relaxin receptor 1-like n=1 Tax=Penaeus indicus TaxID=29960 RepID=UPI00300D00E5
MSSAYSSAIVCGILSVLTILRNNNELIIVKFNLCERRSMKKETRFSQLSWLNSNKVTLEGRRVSPLAHRLQELFLEENEIEKLTQDSLAGLSGLTSLYLRRNRIGRVLPGAFQHQGRLVDFILDGNPLTTIAGAVLRELPALASL